MAFSIASISLLVRERTAKSEKRTFRNDFLSLSKTCNDVFEGSFAWGAQHSTILRTAKSANSNSSDKFEIHKGGVGSSFNVGDNFLRASGGLSESLKSPFSKKSPWNSSLQASMISSLERLFVERRRPFLSLISAMARR